MLNKMYPCLWFPEKKNEAVHFYLNAFRITEVLEESPLASTFTIMGTKCMILEGGPKYKVNPAVSNFVYTGDFGEAERIYNVLKEDGKILMPLQEYDWSSK
jgi:predicted 3-demethylubiquinone-9 3-methyltransferase (glyoxalase superfamily)